ncbi:MAG: alpha/beta hydrolase [Gammaproteobacteria bacterium]|nr:alpha/beta hydrolase [Gammaproteobacteria bacterium]NNF67214.1 alpha/beta fold hydrolase [Gammaproteobacteria bacterium]
MPTAKINGCEIHYDLTGEGSPLLLVHGLGTGGADWEYQVPVLAEQFQVITPSLRGFGGSEKPPGPYSVRLFAQDLAGLLDHLGIDDCHVCGMSMGGAVSFQLLLDYPSPVRSLIAINSQPSFQLNTFKKRMMMVSRVVLARTLGLEREAAIMRRRNFPGRHNREFRRRLAGRFQNQVGPYLDAIDAVSGWTVVDRLGEINVPVLFIAADMDYTSPEEKAFYASMIEDARVAVIADSRHASHLERPDEVNAAMLSFLQEVDGL